MKYLFKVLSSMSIDICHCQHEYLLLFWNTNQKSVQKISLVSVLIRNLIQDPDIQYLHFYMCNFLTDARLLQIYEAKNNGCQSLGKCNNGNRYKSLNTNWSVAAGPCSLAVRDPLWRRRAGCTSPPGVPTATASRYLPKKICF